MNNLPDVAVKELVLIGGGHSHVGLLKMFAMKPLPGLRITLLASDIHTPYSGMLPGFIAGEYSFDEVHLDLRPLSEFANCRLYHSKVTGIDPKQQLIYSDHRPPIKYDLLSVNIGSTPDDFNIPGVRELAIPVKPVNSFITQLETIIHRVLNDENYTTIAIVGGGASGVELVLSIQHRVQLELVRHGKAGKVVNYILLTAAQAVLPSHNTGVRKRILTIFKQRGITLHLDSSIVNISLSDSSSKESDSRNILCSNGLQLKADTVVWCTTASPVSWPEESGLAVDRLGFIQVNDYLQSVSHSNIFAAGDIASMVNYPRPKSGVYAVRQGPPLFNNLKRFVCGKALKAYKPQKHFLSLLNCADKTAVASRGLLAFYGKWVWQYKNWIDVNFMKLFSDLPAMQQINDMAIDHHMVDEAALKRIQDIPMRCGGCSAKVGSTVLKRVIERLTAIYKIDNETPGVIIGLDQADDAAVIEVPDGQLLVQSVDYFKAFINDPYLLGKISANHALGDLFAMGATPHSALALVTLPYSLANITEEELFLMMSGALEVLKDNNMSLVGGHTGEGTDMAFGLSVNGFVAKKSMMTKSGLSVDDVLILTKPLGTGILLAANMRHQAKGRWIEEAIDTMLTSNQSAAQIFNHNGARACTDITGFGLLGHLFEMLKASNVCAQVSLSSLPVLTGTHEMIQQGIFSSLQEENIYLKNSISNIETFSDQQNYPLLFDPQTAGGLLAGIPANQVEQCLHELHSAGYPEAVIIGRIFVSDAADSFVKLSG